jgi:hypothetical protein
MPQEFKIKSDDPWDSIVLADGQELTEGARVYQGEEIVLINGVESSISNRCWGGSYILENGKRIEVTDGFITEVGDITIEEPSMKAKAMALAEERKNK